MVPRRMCFCVAIAALAAIAQQTRAQELDLGEVHFPTSAKSDEAQVRFLRGVAALHSFWYPVALAEFRAATRIEPDFVMGYWGEAMAHNHPIWGDPQNTKAGREALEQISDTSGLTPRERAYVAAVRLLYGEGDKTDRDQAYAEAMQRIHEMYSDDLEAASFYSLALLGTVRSGALRDSTSTRTRMKAAAIALEVYHKQPNHPGAAHYVLHAFDDPDHAILALPAARRYAKIAPAAPHALHMPSHIFLQLGMWPDAAASNESAWAASNRWVKRQELPLSHRDYHSLHWLLYVYMQQGRYQAAEELLTIMAESLPRFPEDDVRNRTYGSYTHASMAAAFVVESRRWDDADELLPMMPAAFGEFDESDAKEASNPYQALAPLTLAPAVFARGLAAANRGSSEANQSIDALEKIGQQLGGADIPVVEDLKPVLAIQQKQIAAALFTEQKKFDQAVEAIKEVIEQVEQMPPPAGPPLAIKPPHEQYGEILLRAGRPEEASRQFDQALFRHPSRALTLLGAARAAARQEHRDVAERHYLQLLKQWRQADQDLSELREVQEYLGDSRPTP